ncbi:CubicO group peptidase (beta-lactamase class C family) [Flavobacterium sp. 270]|uniref:serine hydrolase n=1 Tax=Flavobacterium sp. 270 TaxID=2512114 RepID=UPI0010649EDC|nr:serine hydrolase [Flavobacterium sp. 270]TDW45829.1 CubicO group peptidase (beta-lactamase class C family) [Flavobacterium sp. 270]
MKINQISFQLKAILIGILFFHIQNGFSQKEKNSELYKTIIAKDSLLFNIGFNNCDIKQFEDLLTEDFEFFHDKDSISNKTRFLNTLKSGLCGSPATFKSRRELVDGSTEIFPLYKKGILYGAIQMGAHRFYETSNGKPEQFGSIAKFTHVWLLKNKEWKLSRSLSYDHQTVSSIENKTTVFDDNEITEKWLKENNVPALGIGIIKEGKLKQIKVFGELKKDVSAPYNTIWNVASLTKPVTAIVALKLISQGKWNLDEPVYKYWTDPDIANDPNNKLLTTRIILSHQTGFANWRFMNKSGKLEFQFKPGTKYQYSGEGLEYLRKAMESKFHKTLNQLATELIFEPLKMTDTKYIWDSKTDESRFAIGYDNKGKAYEIFKNKTANAADDLLTTIEDYGTFLCSVMNGDGLSKKVFEEMNSNQVETVKGKHFGLGFEKYDLENGEYALSHGGSDQGVQTLFFILPKTKEGLLIFTNADDGHKVYEQLVLRYLGKNGQKLIDIETK